MQCGTGMWMLLRPVLSCTEIDGPRYSPMDNLGLVHEGKETTFAFLDEYVSRRA